MYTTGDFLIKVQNAYRANKKSMTYPLSKGVVALSKILEKEKYVKSVKVVKPTKENLRGEVLIDLLYENRVPALTKVKLVSKPSVHHYFNKANLRKTSLGRGISILSTSHGVMTGRDAHKEGVGGELICQIY